MISTLARCEDITFVSVCLFVRTERVFLSATACRIDMKIFTRGVNTHVECFNDNNDVIGHIVWQPYWKKGKTLDLYLRNRTKEKN